MASRSQSFFWSYIASTGRRPGSPDPILFLATRPAGLKFALRDAVVKMYQPMVRPKGRGFQPVAVQQNLKNRANALIPGSIPET
ncbi:hypothetical protein [Picosynechococcus sp. NKBG042902]|uniref:hypothetical protein n=1 Tax=Picosynechococcus sp. NKBG042902 TaxID=490193 RepID=UPI001C124551|nr:hypothetical protein [Picosynechococcus sp. NKBG042902]